MPAGSCVDPGGGGGGGTVTVIAAVPVFVSLLAVIVALPAATAVTSPLELTEAMLEFELDHVTTRPVSTLLLASRVVGVSCTVAPMSKLDEVGATVTDATGTGAGALTVIVAIALLPSLVTVICVTPALTAVTKPSELTDAIAGFALEDVTTRPVNTLLLASNAVTWS